MRRFFALIYNEYIKIFAKPSAVIMAASVVLLAAAYSIVTYHQDPFNLKLPPTQGAAAPVRHSDDFYKFRITQTTRNQDDIEHWDIYVEMYQFIIDNIPFTGNAGDQTAPSDWRMAATEYAFGVKITAESDGHDKMLSDLHYGMTDAIERDNWWNYLNLLQGHLEYNFSYSSDHAKETALWETNYRLDNYIKPDHSNWKSNLISEIAVLKQNVDSYSQDETNLYPLMVDNENLHVGLYRLENDIEYFTLSDRNNSVRNINSNFWQIFRSTVGLLIYVGVFVIIIAGGIVSSEFSGNTAKHLLSGPVSRTKIFFAKYAAVVSLVLILGLVYYVTSLILSGHYYGTEQIGAAHIHFKIVYPVDAPIDVKSYPGLLFVALRYLLGSLGVITIVTFAFMLSSITKSSKTATGLGVLMTFLGSGAAGSILYNNLVFPDYSYVQKSGIALSDILKTIVFFNTDINMIAFGMSPIPNHTVTWAVAANIIYIALFLFAAWWFGAMRREIRN
ncbi:MAG: ABC transporter permease [Oscillospiraceae bacterium]|nr:ABC transporter permease [Oscillospiraceae bacterium]